MREKGLNYRFAQPPDSLTDSLLLVAEQEASDESVRGSDRTAEAAYAKPPVMC